MRTRWSDTPKPPGHRCGWRSTVRPSTSVSRRAMEPGAAPGVYALVGTARTWEQDLWVSRARRRSMGGRVARERGRDPRLLGFPSGPVGRDRAAQWLRPAARHGRPPDQRSDPMVDRCRRWLPGHHRRPDVCGSRRGYASDPPPHGARRRPAPRTRSRWSRSRSRSARSPRRGKPGVRLLGSMLDELGSDSIPAASVLEQRLHAVVKLAGLPALVPPVPVSWTAGREGLCRRRVARCPADHRGGQPPLAHPRRRPLSRPPPRSGSRSSWLAGAARDARAPRVGCRRSQPTRFA